MADVHRDCLQRSAALAKANEEAGHWERRQSGSMKPDAFLSMSNRALLLSAYLSAELSKQIEHLNLKLKKPISVSKRTSRDLLCSVSFDPLIVSENSKMEDFGKLAKLVIRELLSTIEVVLSKVKKNMKSIERFIIRELSTELGCHSFVNSSKKTSLSIDLRYCVWTKVSHMPCWLPCQNKKNCTKAKVLTKRRARKGGVTMAYKTRHFEEAVAILRKMPNRTYFDIHSEEREMSFQAWKQADVRAIRAALPPADWTKHFDKDLGWWSYTTTVNGWCFRIYGVREAPRTCRAITEKRQVPTEIPETYKTVMVEQEVIIGWDCGQNGDEG